MELQVQIFGNVDAFGDSVIDDEPDEEWRGRVSDVLIEHRLFSKAKWYMECSRYAYPNQRAIV
jgi:hypothetical protein